MKRRRVFDEEIKRGLQKTPSSVLSWAPFLFRKIHIIRPDVAFSEVLIGKKIRRQWKSFMDG